MFGCGTIYQLMKGTLKDVPLTAMLVDGTIFKGQHLIVAIGIDRLGNKASGAITGTHNPYMGPAIRFEPGAAPRLIPMKAAGQ